MKYPEALGATVHYPNPVNRNQIFRCTVWLIVPAGSRLRDIWPAGVRYDGLTHRVKMILGKKLNHPHYVLRQERVDELGNPKTPRYFVLQEARFESWVLGVAS